MARKKKETLEQEVKETTKKVLEIAKSNDVPEQKFLDKDEVYELMKMTNSINNFKLQLQVLQLQIEKEVIALQSQKLNFQNQLKQKEEHIKKMQDNLNNTKASNNDTEKYKSYVDKLRKKYKLSEHWAYDELTGLIKEQIIEEEPKKEEKH